jgi:hypothetical protein
MVFMAWQGVQRWGSPSVTGSDTSKAVITARRRRSIVSSPLHSHSLGACTSRASPVRISVTRYRVPLPLSGKGWMTHPLQMVSRTRTTVLLFF